MNRLSGEKVSLGQASGADVELVVEGDNEYASYETTDGFPVVYDDSLGLFCYAALDSGRLLSTGVPMAETLRRHARATGANPKRCGEKSPRRDRLCATPVHGREEPSFRVIRRRKHERDFW